jgi:hypothetical protein
VPDTNAILRSLRHSAHDLVREVGKMPAEAPLWQPKEGEWSVHECLTHLRDVERQVFLERIRRTLREDRPRLEFFDEVTYHREHWNEAEPLQSILADFTSARAELVNLLAEAPDWTRVGLHATRGPITLEWQAEYALQHTWEHTSQLMRVRLAREVSGNA